MLKCDYRTAGTRFGAAEPGFGRSIWPAHVAAARRRREGVSVREQRMTGEGTWGLARA